MLHSYARRLPSVAATTSPLRFCLRIFSLAGHRSFASRPTFELEPPQATAGCCRLSPAAVNAALCDAFRAQESTEQDDLSHDLASKPGKPAVTKRKSGKKEPPLLLHLKQDAQLFEGEGIAPPTPRRRGIPRFASNAAASTLAQERSPTDAYTVVIGNASTAAQGHSIKIIPPKFSRPSDLAESAQLLMEEGISQVDLACLSRKRGFLGSTPKKLSAVLQLLKPLAGINACKIIAKNPGLLSQPIEDLEAKLRLFETFGMSAKVIVKLGICANVVLTMKTEVLNQRLQNLESMGFNQEERDRVLLRVPFILRLTAETGLQGPVAYLTSKGMGKQEFLKLVVRRPEILGTTEKSLATKFGMLEGLGLTKDECFRAIPFLWLTSTSAIHNICCLLRSLGFTDDAILSILKKQPDVFAKSEETLKLKLHYLINNYERDRQEISQFPSCLCYDLNNRIIPRLNALREINPQKAYRLSSALAVKQDRFRKRYGIPDAVVLT